MRLFVIDMMPFLYKGYFAFLRSPRITSYGMNTSALLGFANGIGAILKKERPDAVAIAMDPDGPTFRHEAYAPYKAQRQKMPEDIASCIQPAFELADALGLAVERVQGFEADDVMGTIAAKAAAAGWDVVVATPDKDAAQLVRPGVRLYRPGRAGEEAQIYDEARVCEHWQLSSPSQMIDFLALAGDASDNIPGIRGVGEKTAIDLLARYGSVEGIIENAASLKGKLAEKVAAGAEDAKISKFLTRIRTDVPIEPDFERYRLRPYDVEKIRAVAAKYELNNFAAAFGAAQKGASAPAAATAPAAARPESATIETIAHRHILVDTYQGAEELLARLRRETTIAFDTETAASGNFSATDAHGCKLVGFSFAVHARPEDGAGDAPIVAWYVTAEFIDIFRPLFADPEKTFVAHNVKFDRSVLLRYGIGFGGVPRDTMLAHYCLDAAARHGLDALSLEYLNYKPIPIERLIGEKERGKPQRAMDDLAPAEILDYAAEDAEVALRLDDALRPRVEEAGAMRALADCEEPLVKILIDMEREGIRLDTGALAAFSTELDGEIVSLLTQIKSYANPGFNPDSPRQLGELLFDVLGLDRSAAKRTPSGQWSTDEKVLSKLADAHPVVPLVLDYRACAKLKSTYVDKLPALIDEESRVHTTFSQAFTETGRLASSDPNLQNIPVRTERGRKIRQAFVARDDAHVLVSADYSQIELRIMAALSGDEAMLEAFANGEDIHRATAARVYGVMDPLVTAEQRSHCKMVNFGIIYGISAFGLSQRLGISRKASQALIDTYFKLYPKIREFMARAISDAREKGYAQTILGRRRTLRDINSRNATARQAAERDAINTPIQGSAADLIKLAMVRVDRRVRAEGLRARMVLQIHDELLFDCPKDEEARLTALLREEMTHAYDFGVKLDVGIGTGRNWLEAH